MIWLFARQPEISVVILCTANICRSPVAEALLRAALKQRGIGKRVAVSSAGIDAGAPGHPPDPRMVGLARERGVRVGGIRSRPVDDRELEAATFIYVMDTAQRETVLERYPHIEAARVELLDARGDIADPYYAGKQAVREAFEQIERCVHERLADIEQTLEEH